MICYHKSGNYASPFLQFNPLESCKLSEDFADLIPDYEGVLSSAYLYFTLVNYYKVLSSEIINE